MDKIKLAIFGDSFADHFPMLSEEGNWDKGGWPGILAASLSDNRDDFIFQGRSGTSAWYAYSRFLDVVKHNDIERVVFSYTSSQRIPYLPEDIAGEAWRLVIPDDPFLEFEEEDDMYLTYVKYFYNNDYHQFVSQQIFRSVNKICKEKYIKLVNLFPFFDPYNSDGNTTANADYDIDDAEYSVLYDLYKLCILECGSDDKMRYLDTTSGWLPAGQDMRLNHMNNVNNKVIAEKISMLMENNSIVNASKIEGLDYSAETWAQYNSISFHNQ